MRSRPPPCGLHLPPATAPPPFPEHRGRADHPPPLRGPKSGLARARACGPGGAGRQPAARRALAPEVPAPAGSARQLEGGGRGGHPLSTRPLGPGARSCAPPGGAALPGSPPRAYLGCSCTCPRPAGWRPSRPWPRCGRCTPGRADSSRRRPPLAPGDACAGGPGSAIKGQTSSDRRRLLGRLRQVRALGASVGWPGGCPPALASLGCSEGTSIWEDFPLFPPSRRLLLLLLTVMGRRKTISRKRAISLVTVNLCRLEPSPRTSHGVQFKTPLL